jgi:hypothetical protein
MYPIDKWMERNSHDAALLVGIEFNNPVRSSEMNGFICINLRQVQSLHNPLELSCWLPGLPHS